MIPVEVTEGVSPVVLGMPHAGTYVPDDIADRLNDAGRALADTDWHIDKLYNGLLPGATTVRATFHRYVIDANRSPGDESLYPGQNTTGLCPVTDFDGRPIWRDGAEPTRADVAARLDTFHQPYHAALTTQLARVRAEHGHAILYDCHSIRSVIPFLFDGELPIFNIGTANGATCDPEIEATVVEICNRARNLSTIVNGRFRGGWTARHYGKPDTGIHAIQMELAQRAYLAAEAPPWTYDAAMAAPTREVLAEVLGELETVL